MKMLKSTLLTVISMKGKLIGLLIALSCFYETGNSMHVIAGGNTNYRANSNLFEGVISRELNLNYPEQISPDETLVMFDPDESYLISSRLDKKGDYRKLCAK